ncbi:SRPBCC family protein [Microbacterium rhizomatis]|nr:SRPBCC domain-containing protein [Microbacterium rhizomatis]
MIDDSMGFRMVRTFDATAPQVWAAWTDADEAAQWWHPQRMTTPRETVAIDPRVDGRYTYTMVDDQTGESHPTGGVYREVVEGEKLVFTWGRPDSDPDETPVITVTITPLGELTRLTFDIRGVDGMKGDDSYWDGWESALDELADHLGQTAVHG